VWDHSVERHVTLLDPRILTSLLRFWKICLPLNMPVSNLGSCYQLVWLRIVVFLIPSREKPWPLLYTSSFRNLPKFYVIFRPRNWQIPVATHLLGWRVRIPPAAWMPVYCEFCMLWGLCDWPIPHPEEFYRVCMYHCVWSVTTIGLYTNNE